MAIGSIFLLYSILWVTFTFGLWKLTNYNLQKWLCVIPVTKTLWLFQLALEYSTCPWDSEDALVYLSIFAEQIMSILTVICSSTILNCMFYLISIGWCTTTQGIERQAITNVMIVGGSLYLLQLAKNYSSYDDNMFPIVFEMILGIEYVVLLTVCLKNTRMQIAKLESLVHSDDQNLPVVFFGGWKLKIKQLKLFQIVIILFYLPNIADQAYICYMVATYTSNQYREVQVAIVEEFIELINYTILLIIFRPRKEWPDFYGLGINR